MVSFKEKLERILEKLTFLKGDPTPRYVRPPKLSVDKFGYRRGGKKPKGGTATKRRMAGLPPRNEEPPKRKAQVVPQKRKFITLGSWSGHDHDKSDIPQSKPTAPKSSITRVTTTKKRRKAPLLPGFFGGEAGRDEPF